jgi:hypothetical protein
LNGNVQFPDEPAGKIEGSNTLDFSPTDKPPDTATMILSGHKYSGTETSLSVSGPEKFIFRIAFILFILMSVGRRKFWELDQHEFQNFSKSAFAAGLSTLLTPFWKTCRVGHAKTTRGAVKVMRRYTQDNEDNGIRTANERQTKN